MYVRLSSLTSLPALVAAHALPWTAETIARAQDALRAAILYALYGSVSLGLAARWRRVEFAYLGVALLAAVPLWWLVRLAGVLVLGPVWALTLAVEALALGAIALGLKLFRKPLLHVAEAAGVLSGLLLLFNIAADHSWPIVAGFACLGLLWLALAWQHASRWRTSIASIILLAGAMHTLLVNYPHGIWQPWWTAILGHATVMLAAGLLIDAMAGWAELASPAKSSTPMPAANLRQILGEPLEQSALASSLLMALAALLTPWGSSLSSAWCLMWLAALWLVLSFRRSSAALLAAQQTALSLAAVAFAVARLQATQPGRDVWQLALAPTVCKPAALPWQSSRSRGSASALRPARSGCRRADLGPGPICWRRFCVDRIVRFALPLFQWALLTVILLPDAAQEFGEAARSGCSCPGRRPGSCGRCWRRPRLLRSGNDGKTKK